MPPDPTITTPPDDASHPRGPALTGEQAGRLIMRTVERVRQLSKDGWIPREGSGQMQRFRLLDVVQGYIRFRDDADRRSSKSAAQSRITDARSREVELRNAIREGKLIELDEALATVEMVLGVFRQQLTGLPARVTRDLVLRRTMETAIHDILDRIADIAEQRAKALGARAAASAAVPADPAGSVGEGQSDPPADVGGARAA